MSHTTALATITGSTDPAYNGYLGELRDARTRQEAAQIVSLLASVADGLSKAIMEAGPVEVEDENTNRDPLAWAEVATQLTRMSLALNNGVLEIDSLWDNEDEYDWQDVSYATNRRQFAAAWSDIKKGLLARTVAGEDGKGPELRPFAVTQVLAVADAVMDARW